MSNNLKHYGVLGMKWGHRRSNGGSTVSVGRGPSGAVKEIGGLVKDAIKDDVNKVLSVRAKGIEARKATTQKMKSFVSKLGKNVKEHFNRFQVEDSTFTIAALRAQAQTLKKSSDPKDHRVARDLEREAQWMEDDLNQTFTPDEIKKYLGQ